MPEETPPPDDKPRRPWDKNKASNAREEDAEDDEWEDTDRRRRRRPGEAEPDPALKYVVPLNTSALAILAGYVGLVSVLCLPAPFALLLGILALRQLKRNPKLDGKGRAIFAIVMGVVFTVPLVITLAAFATGAIR